MTAPNLPLVQRFLALVDRWSQAECWLWTASLDSRGYGQFNIDGKPQKAHRVAWSVLVGPIPRNMWVLHTCDERRCVRPAHLFLGTAQDNQKDMAKKWRGSKSASGLPFGVSMTGNTVNAYSARIQFSGRNIYLGVFSTAEEASAVAVSKKNELYGITDGTSAVVPNAPDNGS